MNTRLAAILAFGTLRLSAPFIAAADPAPQSFPIPSPDGKSIATTPGQRVFHLPMRFAKAERFYRDRFGTDKGVSLQLERADDVKVLTIVSKHAGDSWAKAVVREGTVDTVLEVTPVVRLAGEQIQGRGLPLVHLVLPVSPEPRNMANSIDHMGDRKN